MFFNEKNCERMFQEAAGMSAERYYKGNLPESFMEDKEFLLYLLGQIKRAPEVKNYASVGPLFVYIENRLEKRISELEQKEFLDDVNEGLDEIKAKYSNYEN